MKSIRCIALAALFCSSLTASAWSATTYKLDDGAGSTNLGPSFACEFMWGNIFDVKPGASVITSISVAFGTLGTPEQRPVRLYLYQMVTPNSPLDAVLVATTTGVSGLAKTNTFLTYDIAPTAVHGQFFVAASMQVFGNATVVPARYDRDNTADAGRSWFFGADSYLNMPLSQAPFGNNMTNNFFQGVFMVRAEGIPSPGSLGFFSVALLAAPRRRR